MNSLAMVITASALAVFVIACAVKLFDIGSSFAALIHKFGVYFAVLLGVISAFGLILPDLLDIANAKTIAFTAVFIVLACSFLSFEFSILRRCMLEPKRKKSRKKGRASAWSVAFVALMDMVSGAMIGATAGISFTLDFGVGLMATCAIILFQTHIKVDLIDRYWKAFFTRGENIFILIVSLAAQLAAAIATYIFAEPRYRFMGVFISAAFGYLLYLCISRLFMIAKSRKKR